MKPLHTRCSRCGRKLKDISARISGMGKTCERKAAEYAERFEPGLFDKQIEVKKENGIKKHRVRYNQDRAGEKS